MTREQRDAERQARLERRRSVVSDQLAKVAPHPARVRNSISRTASSSKGCGCTKSKG